METFNFCPNSLVPELIPREQGTVVSMNSWVFTSKPTTPYLKEWRVTLHGLRWYLDGGGLYDETTDPEVNARALELFYEEHELWKPFLWTHPHTGEAKEYRFKNAVAVPKGIENSNGLVEALEVRFIEHNPGYSV